MSELSLSYCPYILNFKEPAGTSRGILQQKITYFIRIEDNARPGRVGYGEVPVFPGLSSETVEDVEKCLEFLRCNPDKISGEIQSFPSSVIFGIEMALKDLNNNGSGLIYPSDFTNGKTVIDINGLIWMGSLDDMIRRVNEKTDQNFKCIKVKIGAIDWEDELHLLRYIRESGGSDLILRVDANGAFPLDGYMRYLDDLSHFNIHSIEQPVRQGNPSVMRELCEKSPVPVALDEELIGIPPGENREELLSFIKPHYIVIKPALCYGFSGTEDWIKLADKYEIGWWITSALESSLGLNAIAQFTGRQKPSVTQGLGTGSLYTNNLPPSHTLKRDQLYYEGYNSEKYKLTMEALPWC